MKKEPRVRMLNPGRVALLETIRIATVGRAPRPWAPDPLAPKRLAGRKLQTRNERIKRRDRYTCCGCGQVTSELEIDHVMPLSEGGTEQDSNLQSLCSSCHWAKTLREQSQRRGG